MVEAWIVPLLGRLPGVPVGELPPPPPEVVVEEPDLSGYLMPLEPQEPFEGASKFVVRHLADVFMSIM